MNEQLTVSVVIRTYTEDRWEYFIEAIKSIVEQKHLPDQIVVVVDHNLPLLEKVKAHYPFYTVVPNTLSKGSSGAWNSGVQAAQSEIIVFIDDDAVASPSWIRDLLMIIQTRIFSV